MSDVITIESTINAPVSEVWKYYNDPQAMNEWGHADDSWGARDSKVELRIGGRFSSVMYAKDGSREFEFGGTFDKIIPEEYLEYTMDDQRKVEVDFVPMGTATLIKMKFEAENTNPLSMQQAGWQQILDNFKDYCEAK